MEKNRGQAIGNIVMWGAGIAASAAFAFSGFVNNKVSAIEKDNTALVQRVSVVETQSTQYKDDIKDIKMLLQKLNDKLK